MPPGYVEHTFETLHRTPETAFRESTTSRFIAHELRRNGFEVLRGFAETGVLGRKKGAAPGPALAFRADMDALAFEADGRQETLHACGHDANSAILLGLAESTLDKSPERGSLTLLFQPAEETLEGALRVLGSGVLEGVEEMIGIHLRPNEEASLGEATPALVHGASAKLFAKVTGIEAHGARPHQGVNAVEAALLSLNAVKNLAFDSRIPHSVKVTDFHGGTGVFNIIPPKARFTLDIRCQSNELMELARRKLSKAVAAGECTGAHVECDFSEGSPAASYAPETVELAKRAIVKVLGSAIPSISTPGSEDFHFYSVKGGIKTAYIGLGADLKPGLHRREMTFSHQVLSQGVAILKEIVLERLGLS